MHHGKFLKRIFVDCLLFVSFILCNSVPESISKLANTQKSAYVVLIHYAPKYTVNILNLTKPTVYN